MRKKCLLLYGHRNSPEDREPLRAALLSKFKDYMQKKA